MNPSETAPKPLPDLARAGVPDARRHLFVCIGPECVDSAEGEALWETIKLRVKQTGIPAMRTKAACLRVCVSGPWLVVYPEGVWYPEVTPERFEVILQQHLLGGTPVREWVAARNDLQGPACGSSCVPSPVAPTT
jgi:(2Fe-2S) ferredoxin